MFATAPVRACARASEHRGAKAAHADDRSVREEEELDRAVGGAQARRRQGVEEPQEEAGQIGREDKGVARRE